MAGNSRLSAPSAASQASGRTIKTGAGVLFALFAVYLFIAGIQIYVTQCRQRQWPVCDAVVQQVQSRVESRGVKHHMQVTVYDITYAYLVSGQSYTGTITGTVQQRRESEVFSVKYDPADPQNSTHILSPHSDALVANLGGACIFAVVGLWLMGVPQAIKARMVKKGRKEKENYSGSGQYRS